MRITCTACFGFAFGFGVPELAVGRMRDVSWHM